MNTKYYDIENASLEERKKLFETDPNNYIYSVLHNIVDKAHELSEHYEQEENAPFIEIFPFEVITQILNYLIAIYGKDFVFSRIDLIKEEYMRLGLYNFQ